MSGHTEPEVRLEVRTGSRRVEPVRKEVHEVRVPTFRKEGSLHQPGRAYTHTAAVSRCPSEKNNRFPSTHDLGAGHPFDSSTLGPLGRRHIPHSLVFCFSCVFRRLKDAQARNEVAWTVTGIKTSQTRSPRKRAIVFCWFQDPDSDTPWDCQNCLHWGGLGGSMSVQYMGQTWSVWDILSCGSKSGY